MSQNHIDLYYVDFYFYLPSVCVCVCVLCFLSPFIHTFIHLICLPAMSFVFQLRLGDRFGARQTVICHLDIP